MPRSWLSNHLGLLLSTPNQIGNLAEGGSLRLRTSYRACEAGELDSTPFRVFFYFDTTKTHFSKEATGHGENIFANKVMSW